LTSSTATPPGAASACPAAVKAAPAPAPALQAAAASAATATTAATPQIQAAAVRGNYWRTWSQRWCCWGCCRIGGGGGLPRGCWGGCARMPGVESVLRCVCTCRCVLHWMFACVWLGGWVVVGWVGQLVAWLTEIIRTKPSTHPSRRSRPPPPKKQASNHPAISLYEQQGFVAAGIMRNYYDQPGMPPRPPPSADAVLYVHPLQLQPRLRPAATTEPAADAAVDGRSSGGTVMGTVFGGLGPSWQGAARLPAFMEEELPSPAALVQQQQQQQEGSPASSGGADAPLAALLGAVAGAAGRLLFGRMGKGPRAPWVRTEVVDLGAGERVVMTRAEDGEVYITDPDEQQQQQQQDDDDDQQDGSSGGRGSQSVSSGSSTPKATSQAPSVRSSSLLPFLRPSTILQPVLCRATQPARHQQQLRRIVVRPQVVGFQSRGGGSSTCQQRNRMPCCAALQLR